MKRERETEGWKEREREREIELDSVMDIEKEQNICQLRLDDSVNAVFRLFGR